MKIWWCVLKCAQTQQWNLQKRCWEWQHHTPPPKPHQITSAFAKNDSHESHINNSNKKENKRKQISHLFFFPSWSSATSESHEGTKKQQQAFQWIIFTLTAYHSEQCEKKQALWHLSGVSEHTTSLFVLVEGEIMLRKSFSRQNVTVEIVKGTK